MQAITVEFMGGTEHGKIVVLRDHEVKSAEELPETLNVHSGDVYVKSCSAGIRHLYRKETRVPLILAKVCIGKAKDLETMDKEAASSLVQACLEVEKIVVDYPLPNDWEWKMSERATRLVGTEIFSVGIVSPTVCMCATCAKSFEEKLKNV